MCCGGKAAPRRLAPRHICGCRVYHREAVSALIPSPTLSPATTVQCADSTAPSLHLPLCLSMSVCLSVCLFIGVCVSRSPLVVYPVSGGAWLSVVSSSPTSVPAASVVSRKAGRLSCPFPPGHDVSLCCRRHHSPLADSVFSDDKRCFAGDF